MAEKRITYWWSAKYGNQRPKKRYVILFSLKGQYGGSAYSLSEYDNLKDCNEECDEINKLYVDHPLPVLIDRKWNKVYPKKRHLESIYDYSGGKSWWGYIVLDFVECKCIRVGGNGFHGKNGVTYSSCKHINNSNKVRDYFFRDPNECPDEYVFKPGEYEGWLQFKWGDGKNAIGYIEPPKTSKKKKDDTEIGMDFETSGLDDFPKPDDFKYDEIETRFEDIINKETQKRLMDKFGW